MRSGTLPSSGAQNQEKPRLAEAMLFEGGIISRRGTVEDKNTVSDYRPIELERQNSVVASVLYTLFDNKKINIIDTPGFDDFIGEVVAALKVVDTAMMVVNAQNGVEVGTEITWRYTNKNNTPVIFVVNHLDQENANFDETFRQLQAAVRQKRYPDAISGQCRNRVQFHHRSPEDEDV